MRIILQFLHRNKRFFFFPGIYLVLCYCVLFYFENCYKRADTTSRSRWSLLSAKSSRFVLQKKKMEGRNGRRRLLFSVRCPFNEKSAPGVQTVE